MRGVPLELVRTYHRERLPSARELYYWYPDGGPSELVPEGRGLPELAVQLGVPAGRPTLLYAHVPYCRRRCLFCACNARVASRAVVREYGELLLRELEALEDACARVGWRPLVDTVHLGGGTPSLLPDDELAALVARLRTFAGQPREVAIELDPRVVDAERLRRFAGFGVDRLSFGIQDFDDDVLAAVGRPQPAAQVEALVAPEIRSLFPNGVNFDLVVGLPRQTPESWARTLERVCRLRPDRVATNPLTCGPDGEWRLGVEPQPSREHRVALEVQASDTLCAAGYVQTGFDHFALPGDALAEARARRTLVRNQIGSTPGRYDDTIALGAPVTSRLGPNSLGGPTLAPWVTSVRAGRAPQLWLRRLSADEQARASVINSLVSFLDVDVRAVEARHGIEFATTFARELDVLRRFERDGLLTLAPERIALTALGANFVLPVADVFGYDAPV